MYRIIDAKSASNASEKYLPETGARLVRVLRHAVEGVSAHHAALRHEFIGECLRQSPPLTFGHVGDPPRGVGGESQILLLPDALVLRRSIRRRRGVLPRTPLTRAATVFPDIHGTVIIVRGRIGRIGRISVVELSPQRELVTRGGGAQGEDVRLRGLEVKPLQRPFLGHEIVVQPELASRPEQRRAVQRGLVVFAQLGGRGSVAPTWGENFEDRRLRR